VDDVRHVLRVDQRLERRHVGDVALHARDTLELGRLHHERHSARILPDVVRDHIDVAARQIRDDPRADAPTYAPVTRTRVIVQRAACGVREPLGKR
jgi:hypothetical protein